MIVRRLLHFSTSAFQLVSKSYQVRLNGSAFGLRAHMGGPPLSHSRGSGNLLRGGLWAVAVSVVPLISARTWYQQVSKKADLLTSALWGRVGPFPKAQSDLY